MPRKRVHIEPDEIERYGRLGCTVAEVAALYGLAQSSMSERLTRSPLKEPWQRGLATAKVSVRRNLMRLAFEENNVAASIWLSKVLCRDQEPPRESRVETDVRSDVQTTYICTWGGQPFDDLPRGDGEVELLETRNGDRYELPAGNEE